mmetsp:Transcript_86265/g.249141  ORF Transcript_86265/g.249141 Transcript_86265/m.249141 type:complete len:201 (-) Transcript_86265:357-959(-)
MGARRAALGAMPVGHGEEGRRTLRQRGREKPRGRRGPVLRRGARPLRRVLCGPEVRGDAQARAECRRVDRPGLHDLLRSSGAPHECRRGGGYAAAVGAPLLREADRGGELRRPRAEDLDPGSVPEHGAHARQKQHIHPLQVFLQSQQDQLHALHEDPRRFAVGRRPVRESWVGHVVSARREGDDQGLSLPGASRALVVAG